MDIQSTLMTLSANRMLATNQLQLAQSLEKLSSGLRINRAGDDAAGLAISQKMRADTMIFEMASRNAQDGISLIQTAEGALTETHSMLNRMAELATQASNGIYDDEQRMALDNEFQALKSEIDRISNGTNFNGKNLLDGNLSGGLKLQIGNTADQSNIVSVNVDNMGTGGLGLTSLGISSLESAQSSLGAIKDAINTVSSQRASLGALQNRQEHTISNLGVTIENLTAAESRIRDTDMAKEIMNFTKNSLLLQSAQSMSAQANLMSQSVIKLLR